MSKNNFVFSLIFALLFSATSFAQEAPAIVDPENPGSSELIINKADPSRFYNAAIIQGLNKTTAKTSTLEMRIGDKIHFGQISIIAHKCWQAPLDQKPESKILLEVLESKNNEPEKRIFYGWMFASSPSISGLEHPIYDLTAIGCKSK